MLLFSGITSATLLLLRLVYPTNFVAGSNGSDIYISEVVGEFCGPHAPDAPRLQPEEADPTGACQALRSHEYLEYICGCHHTVSQICVLCCSVACKMPHRK
mgnify:CR=1 FL=1